MMMDNRYDRQVRLWGASTQQQLCRTTVSCEGLSYGLTSELIKNLVLGGVGRVLLRDREECVSLRDMTGNPLLRLDDIGQIRAPLMAQRAGEMNPLVKVVAVSSSGLVDDAIDMMESGGMQFEVKELDTKPSRSESVVPEPSSSSSIAAAEDSSNSNRIVWTFAWSWVSVACFTDTTVTVHPLLTDAATTTYENKNNALYLKPWPYQLAVLLAHVGVERLQKSSFAQRAGALFATREALLLTAVTDELLQTVLDELDHNPTGCSSTVAATVAGAMVAQQVITRVGRQGQRSAAPTEAETTPTALPEVYGWYAFGFQDGSGECYVG